MAEQAAGRPAGRSTRFTGNTPPKTFLGKRTPQEFKVNNAQILTLMDQAAELAEKEAFELATQNYAFVGVGVSRDVETALRQASGVRVPIKCFGCNGLEPEERTYHLWRDCPNKLRQEIWLHFQKSL